MARLIRDLFTKEWRWVETEPKRVYAAPRQESRGPTFVPDIAPFVSPIDRSEITSRSQLREHERRHGVRQCGELSKPSDYDNSGRMRESFNEGRFNAAFRHAVNRVDGIKGD